MAQNQVLGVVSIHRLRTGATVQLYLSVSKGLYQNVVGSTCSPDWSVADNRPVVTPQVTGATMTNPKWYKDGTQISNGTDYSIDANGKLTFLKSPVDLNSIHNITYTFKCDVSTGGTSETIERSIMVMVHEGGENSYWGNINAPGGTVLGEIIENNTSKTVESLTLEPTLWCGSTKKQYGSTKDYIVKWYKTAGKFNSTTQQYEDLPIESTDSGKYELSDNGKLIVYRDGVDGMAHFECHFFSPDGQTEYEAEGIQVVDNKDDYFISIAGDKNVYTGSGSTVELVASVYTHGSNTFKAATSWAAKVTDSERMGEYPSNTYGITKNSDGSGKFTMSEANMFVPNTGSDKESKPWIKIGDAVTKEAAEALDVSSPLPNGAKHTWDEAVAATKDATPCDVIVQFIATI